MNIHILFAVICIVAIMGCTTSDQLPENTPKEACIKLCLQYKAENVELSGGSCLSNSIAEDYVCDVAHSPRQEVDNDPENQCSAFGRTAHHFIEVDPDCNFIREV